MSATATATRPTRLLQPEVLAGLANLELVARAVVEGFLIGLHRSPRFGFSQEFAEYRAYAEGDDPRFIDWNVYARTDRAYIKRFLGETNSHLIILLDASASMGIATQNISKLRYGQFLAASLAYLASKQHDAVGTLIFDDQTRAYRAPSSRAGKFERCSAHDRCGRAGWRHRSRRLVPVLPATGHPPRAGRGHIGLLLRSG